MRLEKIELGNGKFLSRQYGKYDPDLIIVYDNYTDSDSDYQYRKLNEELVEKVKKFYDAKSLEIYRGDYRINKKGNKIFEFKSDGKYFLIGIHWGGAFSETAGSCDIKYEKVYSICKISNGGKLGSDWEVVEVEKYLSAFDTNNISEDNF